MRLLVARSSHFVAAIALAAIALSGSAIAAERSGFGIRPSSGGEWFRFRGVPGETITDSVTAMNTRAEPIQLRIYAADAQTSPQGGFSLGDRLDQGRHVGRWIELQPETLHLKPGERRTVPFRLTVPAATEPGDYAGGILLETAPERGKSASVGNQMDVQLDVIERVGVRIYLNVEGEVDRQLGAGPLKWRRGSEGVEFRLPITNEGNVRLAVEGVLRVSGSPGSGARLQLKEQEVLPGSASVMTAVWENAPSTFLGRAVATVDYGADDPLRRGASVRMVSIPLLVGIVAAALAVGLAVWRILRFWRRARAALRLVQSSQAESTKDVAASTASRRSRRGSRVA